MSPSPNSSLHHSTGDPNPTSSIHPPDPPLRALSATISNPNTAQQRNPNNNNMRPRNPPNTTVPAPAPAESPPNTTTTTTTSSSAAALQIAEERHAREIQHLEGKHAQDLEALRGQLNRAHDAAVVDLKMALYAEHRRDLLELKEERERGLERLKAFFSAVRAREGSVAFSSPAPADGGVAGGFGSMCPAVVVARVDASAGTASTATAGSTSTSTTTTTNPTTTTTTSSPPPSPETKPTSSNTTSTPTTSPTTDTNTAPSSPPHTSASPGAVVPRVRFLTTGITAAEAKREGGGAKEAEGRVGRGLVKSALKAVGKGREGGRGRGGGE